MVTASDAVARVRCVSLLTTAAMVAFAANPVLPRGARRRGDRAASFSAIRLCRGRWPSRPSTPCVGERARRAGRVGFSVALLFLSVDTDLSTPTLGTLLPVPVGRLSHGRIEVLATPGLHGDGDTLYLRGAAGGSKSWIQRVTINGLRRDLGLGGWPVVSFARARQRAFTNRIAISEGRDPLAEKRKASVPTFRGSPGRSSAPPSSRSSSCRRGSRRPSRLFGWSARSPGRPVRGGPVHGPRCRRLWLRR